MLVPLRAHLVDTGVLLVVLGAGRGTLAADEAELLASFTDQASLALDRAQAVSDREELMLVADRDRIARDLHDLVIQRLFATGLHLQGARRMATGDDVRARLDAAVADLDVTIRDIRSTIFDLQLHTTRRCAASCAAWSGSTCRSSASRRWCAPAARWTRPWPAVRAPRSSRCCARRCPTWRGMPRPTRRWSRSRSPAPQVTLRVTDNGQGLPAERRESGLRNVRRRAGDLGGTVRFLEEEPHGTVWSGPSRSTVPRPRHEPQAPLAVRRTGPVCSPSVGLGNEEPTGPVVTAGSGARDEVLTGP